MFSDMDKCLECMFKRDSEITPSSGELGINHLEEMSMANCLDASSVVSIGLVEDPKILLEKTYVREKPEVYSDGLLFREFIVEFERFLRKFVVDREINIE